MACPPSDRNFSPRRDDPLKGFGLDLPDDEWLERIRQSRRDPQAGAVGGYEIEAEISRGAQGIVYRARQPNMQRHIALKRLIAGSFATADMRARFEREMRVAAELHHPNIVTVYGAEIVDGQPNLAMEWIDGLPVDRWTAGDGRNRRAVDDSLRMFAVVCDAVHHAHQRGVIHRDLKPSNILVDAHDQPHILDFGLAKLMHQDDSGAVHLTRTQDFVGTPAYASPEQVRGDAAAIDLRSDVYALGVILFQMLTGRLPYPDDRNLANLLHAIQHVDPPPPSSVAPEVDRELDLIALKSLARDPAQRYQSVDALGDDLRRYLAGEPVLAHPPSALYQLRKLIRRHRWPAAWAATVLLMVVAAAVVASGLAVQIAHERDRAVRAETAAEDRFNDVRQLARAMIFDVHEKLAPVAGATEARRALVQTSLDYLDRLSAEAGDDRDLLLEIAEGYHRLGAVQGLRTMGSLGDLNGAHRSFDKMQAICRALVDSDPDDVRGISLLAGSYRAQGDVLTLMGRRDEALRCYQQQLDLHDRVAALTPQPTRPLRHAYVARIQTAKLLRARGDDGGALELYRQARDDIERQLPAFPEHTDLHRDLALVLALRGDVLHQNRRYDEAGAVYELAMEKTQALAQQHPDNDQFQRDLAVRWQEVGDLALSRKDSSAALAAFTEGLRIHQRLAEADPSDVVARRDLSIAHEKVGDVARARADWPAALADYEGAYRITSALAEAQPENASQHRDVCVIRTKVAGARVGIADHETAVELLRENLAALDALIEADAADTGAFDSRLQSLQLLADAQQALGQFDEAFATLERYHETAAADAQRFADSAWVHRHLGVAAYKIGGWLERRGSDASGTVEARIEDLRAARAWYERGRATAEHMRDAGLADANEIDVPDRFAEDAARCDAAIEALESQT